MPVQETWIWSQVWDDHMKEGMATCSSIPAWGLLWTEKPGELQSIASQSQTRLKQLNTNAWYSFSKFRGARNLVFIKLNLISQSSPCFAGLKTWVWERISPNPLLFFRPQLKMRDLRCAAVSDGGDLITLSLDLLCC